MMNITQYINSEDADERYDFESHVFENVWDEFVKYLPTEQDWANHSVDVWYYADADEILCLTEELMIRITDMIEGISGEHEAENGYYDPVVDEEIGATDGRTGWYFIRHY